ncbi:MAG: ROK family transcriptional regulator [Victivallaceae bacterium]|jgi:predicted NBD/HSP70 family sugar kinase
MDKTKSNQKSRRQILRLIKDSGQISRAELAKLTGLTRPTVSAIINELNLLGLISETGKGESCGGKRPIMLELNKKSFYAVGIDLGDDFQIRGVLCDLHGNVVRREELEYENRFECILEVLTRLIEKLTAGTDPRKVKGVGIAISGIVDTEANEVISSKTFDIENKKLAKKLAVRCSFHVILENRPNAAALAETEFGAGKNFRNLVYITSGRGVGAGIVIDGKIFRGSFGTAGEIGEMLVPEPSGNAVAGKCFLQEMTRTKAICEAAEKVKRRKITYQEILQAYQDGDQEIIVIIDKNAEYMAYAAQLVAKLLNPEAIILGGRALELGEKYFASFKKYFDSGFACSDASNKTEVRYSACGRLGVAVGGAAVVLDMVMNFKV